ncbi:uncharacterized protein L203_104650 [Cryptococcus depauperatus CBS 7841]|uniref:Uncharacterized protein n=1 Tax=Cryptococcus depauperatus CBS 7841 TaxID=1295531 RepID=A0A1E3INC0_9TREE|nr:hypothetical protein L203_02146 [Cryptococcus depauperatus CBS 7841]
MLDIPQFLKPYLENYPLQAGPLLTSVKDLSLSIGWSDLRVVRLKGEEDWVVVVGRKKKQDPLRAILPLPLHTTSLRPSSLRSIFSGLAGLQADKLPEPIPPFAPLLDELCERLGKIDQAVNDEPQGQEQQKNEQDRETLEVDQNTLYMAIVTGDSTVVYYKVSKGIKKPADIPDE